MIKQNNDDDDSVLQIRRFGEGTERIATRNHRRHNQFKKTVNEFIISNESWETCRINKSEINQQLNRHRRITNQQNKEPPIRKKKQFKRIN